MHILPYFEAHAEFRPHDPIAAFVAVELSQAIRSIAPDLSVEHIGSSSVPGCGGKGVIDLAVLYPEDGLERSRKALDELGFQRQGGPEPFPESRPMRVGAVEHGGQTFRVHAHVIARDSDEHHELVWFRDALRARPDLRARYEARKQEVLARGIIDPIEYCKAKGDFITDALKLRRTPL